MLAIIYSNYALRFGLELCALGALGYWGFTTSPNMVVRLIVGIGAPLVAAVVWGLFASPRATYPLSPPAQIIFEIVFFGIAFGTLAAAGRTRLAITFAVLLALSMAVTYLVRE